jgi:tetratricopeptide (TPR) repeat protein
MKFLSIILIYLIPITILFSQDRNDSEPKEKFPEFLIQENEYLATFPKSNFIFVLDSSDFILCKKNPLYFKENSIRKQNFNIEFQNKIYQDLGEFNNEIISFYLKTNDLMMAIENLEKGYNNDPLFFAILYNLGRFYFIKKDYHKSIFYFNKTFYYFPNYPRIHYYLGKTYYFINDEIQGEYHFKKAIQLNPQQSEYLIDLINILYDKKQYSKAKLYLEYGEKIFIDNSYFKIHRARYLIKEMKYQEALKILHQIDIKNLNEYEQLELKYTMFILYEKTHQLEKALKEINDLLSYNNPYFYNKYNKTLFLSEKERIQKIIK